MSIQDSVVRIVVTLSGRISHWTVGCFAALLHDIDSVKEERYYLMRRVGISYQDWRIMARWQRFDLIARHKFETIQVANQAKKGFNEVLKLIIAKILGLG